MRLTVEELEAAINEGAKYFDSRGMPKVVTLPLIGSVEFFTEEYGIEVFDGKAGGKP